MIHLLIVILDDVKRLPDLLKAWRAAGVPGVTLLTSAGGYRVHNWLERVGLGALDRLFESQEVQRRTLLVAIEDEHLLDRAIAEAERVLDGFDRPNSGLLLVMPVAQARGLHKARAKAAEPVLPPAVQPDWLVRRDTPIDRITAVTGVQPVVVQPDTPLDELARQMAAQPQVQVACVAAEGGRLVGLITLRTLVDALFFHILPEEFLSEISDLDEVMAFAEKTRMRTAGDAMQQAVWIRRDETVKTAFKRMHEHRLPGLPVVDDGYRVLDYVSLIQLLTLWADRSAATPGEGSGP